MGAERLSFGELPPVEPIGYEDYKLMAHDFDGPQLVEYSELDFARTVRDSRTRYAQIDVYGDTKAWPVLTPINNYTEYVPDYFERRYGEEQASNTYHLRLPTLQALDVHPESHADIAKNLIELAEQDAVIVFDELDGKGTQEYIESLLGHYYPDVELAVDELVDDKNGTPTAAIHYAGLAIPNRDPSDSAPRPNSAQGIHDQFMKLVETGEVDPSARSTTVLLDPARMDEVLPTGVSRIDRLWEIYNGQFTRLIENNPCRGAQTRQEVEMMARDPGTYTVAHMVDGDIVSFGTFVGNIEACDWLNADYYKDAYPGEMTLYFPGIATDIEKQGQHYSLDIATLLSKIVGRSVDSARIVFQCTNISSEYIPKIVEAGVNLSGEATISVEEACRYNYRAFKIKQR